MSTVSGAAVGTLTGALFNMTPGRNVELTVHQLVDAVIVNRLDFVCLQSVDDYAVSLDRQARSRGWRLIHFSGTDEGILVTKDVEDTRAGLYRLSPLLWSGRDHHRPVLSMPHVLLDGWLRVASVCQPVGVEWSDGEPVGPGHRVKALRVAARRMVRFARWRARHDLVLAGTFGVPPTTEGRYAPRWIAAEVDARVKAPVIATAGPLPGRPPVDYVIAAGCSIDLRRVCRVGGNHRLVVFRARRSW